MGMRDAKIKVRSLTERWKKHKGKKPIMLCSIIGGILEPEERRIL